MLLFPLLLPRASVSFPLDVELSAFWEQVLASLLGVWVGLLSPSFLAFGWPPPWKANPRTKKEAQARATFLPKRKANPSPRSQSNLNTSPSSFGVVLLSSFLGVVLPFLLFFGVRGSLWCFLPSLLLFRSWCCSSLLGSEQWCCSPRPCYVVLPFVPLFFGWCCFSLLMGGVCVFLPF